MGYEVGILGLLLHVTKISESIAVREDTLCDMVSRMTEQIGVVSQIPFACDRSGIPATLEKVKLWHASQRQ